MKEITLTELAEMLGGELTVPGDVAIRGLASIDSAGPDEVTFLANVRYGGRGPYFHGLDPRASIDPSAELADGVAVGPFAVIGPGARIGPGTAIYPGAYVGRNVRIGRDCVIHPQVTLYEGTIVGDRVRIHAGRTTRFPRPGGSSWPTTSRSARVAPSNGPRSARRSSGPARSLPI